jgi:hypothetical protein
LVTSLQVLPARVPDAIREVACPSISTLAGLGRFTVVIAQSRKLLLEGLHVPPPVCRLKPPIWAPGTSASVPSLMSAPVSPLSWMSALFSDPSPI